MGTEDRKSRKDEQTLPMPDLECVWVKAGIIGSTMCDMNFECERCPLDMALRQGFCGPHEEGDSSTTVPAAGVNLSELGIQRAEVREKVLNKFFQQLEQFSLQDDRYYYRSHTWVQDGGRKTTTIGVNDFAARLLPHANSIVFPSVGSRVQQGEYCSWFVSPDGTIAFVSPVTGTIVDVNDELYEMPDLVRTSPYEKGWLARIELDRFPLDVRKLLPRISANARCRKDIERLRRQLFIHSKVDVPSAGLTLLDGGRYVENVQSLLGLKKYVELISVLFRP